MTKHHSERAHSKFSASGAERWFNCPGSVALSEGVPDTSSVYADEGTQAHEILEAYMRCELGGNDGADVAHAEELILGKPLEMLTHASTTTKFITDLHYALPGSEALVETRIYLDFIHPEMFGTFDGAVIDYFGTLHVFDYKYGKGHLVVPQNNLQMIFYALGLAYLYHWNFKSVKVWIIQPRVKGYHGPLFWEISTTELMRYVETFKLAVSAVERHPNKYKEGSWCHWCKAKSKCPLKKDERLAKAKARFPKF